MPNYNPNYIYQPRYGSRYMGNRTPAPASGGIGESDPLSQTVASGEDTPARTGTPNNGPTAMMDGPSSQQQVTVDQTTGAQGWSNATGRESGLGNMSTFGFRGLGQADPLAPTPTPTAPTPTTSTPSTPTPVTSTPTAPTPVASDGGGDSGVYKPKPIYDPSSMTAHRRASWGSGGGLFGTAEDPFGLGVDYGGYSHNLPGGQGVSLAQQDIGWKLLDYPWFLPGGLLAKIAGGAMLDNQLTAMGKVDDALKAGPVAGVGTATNFFNEPLVQVSDKDGNLRTVTQSQANALMDLAANTRTKTGLFGTSGSMRDDGYFSSSAFGTGNEAKSVALHGLGSDQQFYEVNDIFDQLRSGTGRYDPAYQEQLISQMGGIGSLRNEAYDPWASGFQHNIANVDTTDFFADDFERAIAESDQLKMQDKSHEARFELGQLQEGYEKQDKIEYDQAIAQMKDYGILDEGKSRKELQRDMGQVKHAVENANRLGVNVKGMGLQKAQDFVAESQKKYNVATDTLKKYGVDIGDKTHLATAEAAAKAATDEYRKLTSESSKYGVNLTGTNLESARQQVARTKADYNTVKSQLDKLGVNIGNKTHLGTAKAALKAAQKEYADLSAQAKKVGVKTDGMKLDQARQHVKASTSAYNVAKAKAKKYGVNISGKSLASAQMEVSKAETAHNMAVTQAKKAGVSTSGTTAQIKAQIKSAATKALAKNSSKGTSSLTSKERAAIVAHTGKSPPNVNRQTSSSNPLSGKKTTPKYDFNVADFTDDKKVIDSHKKTDLASLKAQAKLLGVSTWTTNYDRLAKKVAKAAAKRDEYIAMGKKYGLNLNDKMSLSEVREKASAAKVNHMRIESATKKYGLNTKGMSQKQALDYVKESTKAYKAAEAKAKKYGISLKGKSLAKAQSAVSYAETKYNMAVTQAKKAGLPTSGTTSQLQQRIAKASRDALAKNSKYGSSSLTSKERAAIVAHTGKSPPNVRSASSGSGSSGGGYYGDNSGGTNRISGKSYTPNYDFNPNDFTSNYGGSSSSSSSSGGRWCCSSMVHAGLWSEKREFARMTSWSIKRFAPKHSWWLQGYNKWGKWVAKNIVSKFDWGKDLMQSFYDYHVESKPYSYKTFLAQAIIFPASWVVGTFGKEEELGAPRVATKEEIEG